jgi:hypothetical protein
MTPSLFFGCLRWQGHRPRKDFGEFCDERLALLGTGIESDECAECANLVVFHGVPTYIGKVLTL